MKSRIEIKRICAWCGKEFIAYKTTTNCCSHKCGNALYKKRKRDAAIIVNNNLTEKIVTEKPIEKIKDKPFLTITETAIYLGVTRPTIYGYLKRGDLKATRIGTKFLLSKDDINNMFNHPADFKLPPKEKQAITEFYTTAEIIEKFNVSESWIFVMAKKNKIPKTFNRGKTYWSKKHVDAYFSSKAPDADITEWYSVQEVQDKFQMSLNAIYSFVYKNAIPKKKVGITVYYSKKHFDIAKGIRQAEEPKYYTVREAMEKFKITRDQLYHYTKYHQIPKIKKGKYTLISKPELDNLFEDPLFEQAARKGNYTIIDGFSFSQPRIFSGRYFDYDVVIRDGSRIKNEDNFVPRVFHLYKPHGSVDWEKTENNVFQNKAENIPVENSLMIFPQENKYEHSYEQPFFEMMTRFQTALRLKNTTLVVIGFSFGDKHILSMINEALEQNPSFQLIIINYRNAGIYENDTFYKEAEKRGNIIIVNETFADFVDAYPDIKIYDQSDEYRLVKIVNDGN